MFMNLVLLFCLSIAVQGFTFNRIKFVSKQSIYRMSEETPTETKTYDIVPVDKASIESAASVTGAFLGLVLGGPVFAAILAAITNYVSKKEDDSGEAIRGVGKTVVESYNFLTKLNAKYDITGKVTNTVGSAVSKIESDSEVFETVKKTVSSTTTKLSELDKEYDLITKGKEIIVAAGTLSDAAIDKLVELNAKYDFVETTKKAATTAVEKVKEQTGAKSSE